MNGRDSGAIRHHGCQGEKLSDGPSPVPGFCPFSEQCSLVPTHCLQQGTVQMLNLVQSEDPSTQIPVGLLHTCQVPPEPEQVAASEFKKGSHEHGPQSMW